VLVNLPVQSLVVSDYDRAIPQVLELGALCLIARHPLGLIEDG
jgi:hypothetical protein